MRGVLRFAKVMDSNDEEAMASLMDEKVATTARDVVGDEEILSILVTLLAMIYKEDKPIIDGSASGRRKSKPTQRIEFLVFGADPYEWMGPLADVDHQVPPAFATFSPVFKKLRHQYSSPTRR
jgi:hypothetical protein